MKDRKKKVLNLYLVTFLFPRRQTIPHESEHKTVFPLVNYLIKKDHIKIIGEKKNIRDKNIF